MSPRGLPWIALIADMEQLFKFCEDEYVTLRALQHTAFCSRRCALIHTERVWTENALTAMGRMEHERVDSAEGTTRGTVRTARTVQLVCHRLGIQGVADVVEYKTTPHGVLITPVEYKHGRPENHRRADEVQLCAQTFCLEEMHQCHIETACLFYHRIRRRYEVKLDRELREMTEKIIAETRELLSSGTIPPANKAEHCKSCSLNDYCLPRDSSESASVYTERVFNQMVNTP